jgi:hypothetical protein
VRCGSVETSRSPGHTSNFEQGLLHGAHEIARNTSTNAAIFKAATCRQPTSPWHTNITLARIAVERVSCSAANELTCVF